MKNKLFGIYTGLPASELILGAANFGSAKGNGTAKEDIPQILREFVSAGGNTIDLADQYQLGEAEVNVGRFIKDNRQNFIISTKYSLSSGSQPLSANKGNHSKAMRQGVEASLKRLGTDYIDLYMPHFDDGITPIAEIARGMEDLVQSGKVLYIGLANFPAWKVAAIAGEVKLTALQFEYNLVQRSADRELIAVAEHFGLAQMLYSPLAGGLLTGKYRKGETGRLSGQPMSAAMEDDQSTKILDLLQNIAIKQGVTMGQIAMAWIISKNVFPIIGARKMAHLEESLASLDIKLTPEQLHSLDQTSAVQLGYPHDLLKKVQTIY
jgi:aryl-alcohol dehydrogenase-like predicted oxidoreductase